MKQEFNETSEEVTVSQFSFDDEALKELYELALQNYNSKSVKDFEYQPLDLDWCGIQVENLNARNYATAQQFISRVWNHVTSAYLTNKYNEFANDKELNKS